MIRKQIPNVLTLSNLVSGLMVIVCSFQYEFFQAALFALVCLVADFLDGTAARMLKVQSDIGKELDSMADMVSFGAAPGLVLYNFYSNIGVPYHLEYLALLIPAFAGYRLAKFNISSQSTEYFTGLPTPALALAAFGIPLTTDFPSWTYELVSSGIFLAFFVIVGSYLMNSSWKLLSFKVGSANLTLNRLRLIILICAVPILIIFKFFGLFLCLIMYIVISLTVQNRLQSS
ncbi:CDP-diacylglycerol--serine O-phosphatidyltransferase [bacterium]|nr:CDP-diacylglycerol--serine O-phosphatidyltransferase [bacterium]